MGVSRWWRGGVAIVAVMLAAGCGGVEAASEPEPSPSPMSGPVASDGGGIVIAESGFTVLSDGDVVVVSYGLLLRNESRVDAVANTSTALTWLDESGAQIASAAGRVADEEVGITWLPPGASMAVAGTMELADVPVEPEIGLSKFDWIPVSLVDGWGELISTEASIDEGDPTTIDFTVMSTFNEAIDVEASALLRDAGGLIVGGTSWRDSMIGTIESGELPGKITVDESQYPTVAETADVYPHVAYGTWDPVVRP
ncbi:hypothetical protein [Stackebrandtia soli]|uniref:hypothetical protein n=1 Tax=Stackebrandtia soli TaxID=1892856 RepID=UPI0039E920F9